MFEKKFLENQTSDERSQSLLESPVLLATFPILLANNTFSPRWTCHKRKGGSRQTRMEKTLKLIWTKMAFSSRRLLLHATGEDHGKLGRRRWTHRSSGSRCSSSSQGLTSWNPRIRFQFLGSGPKQIRKKQVPTVLLPIRPIIIFCWFFFFFFFFCFWSQLIFFSNQTNQPLFFLF